MIRKQYQAERAAQGGDHKSEEFNEKSNELQKSQCHSDTLIYQNDIASKLASENDVSRKTVFRASEYAKGIDATEDVQPGIRDEILSGK